MVVPFFMATLVWLLSFSAFASSAVIVPSSRTLQVGQSIAIELQLVDIKPGAPPNIPTDDGLRIQYQGMSTMHEMVNFQSRTIYKLRYVVTGLEEGVFTVGPLRLVHDGRPLQVEPLRLTVEPRSTESEGSASIRSTVSTKTPFEGQVVLYNIQYQFRKNVTNLSMNHPEFSGFQSVAGIEAVQSEHHIYDNQELLQIREVSFPLIANKVGNYRFEPVQLTVDLIDASAQQGRSRSTFDNFFQQSASRRESFISDPISVDIRPLPTPPVGFSGLIGAFRLDATPSERQVRAGESLNIEIRLSGEGSLQGYKLPEQKNDAYRSYGDEPQRSVAIEDEKMKSTLTQNVAIVPEAEGDLFVEPLEIIVFDINEEKYMTLRSAPIKITVLPGGEQTANLEQYTESVESLPVTPSFQTLGTDIRSVSGKASVRENPQNMKFIVLMSLPLLACILGGLKRWRDRKFHPQILSLKNLPTEPKSRLRVQESIFRSVVAKQLSISPDALLPTQIDAFDKEAALLRSEFAAARFGGQFSKELEPRINRFVRRFV